MVTEAGILHQMRKAVPGKEFFEVPGADGWQYQNYAGIPDVPQIGHDKPEILTYFERVGGGDEFVVVGDPHLGVRRHVLDGLVHRAQVAHAVIDDGNHTTHGS